MQRRIKLSHNFLWMLLTTKADERIATYKICWLSNKKVSPAHSPPKERANVINFLIKHPWRDSVSVELHSLDPAALLKMNSAWAVLRIVQHHPPLLPPRHRPPPKNGSSVIELDKYFIRLYGFPVNNFNLFTTFINLA